MTRKSADWDWGEFDNFTQDGLSIRSATDSDFPFIEGLVSHPSTVQAMNDTSESAKAAIGSLWAEGLDAPDMRHFLVESEQFTDPIAYLRLLYPFQGPECLWLSYFAVVPSLRGQGYGRKILHLLLSIANGTKRVRKFGMHTDSSNDRAIKLYSSLGFECIDCEPRPNEGAKHRYRLTFCRSLGMSETI